MRDRSPIAGTTFAEAQAVLEGALGDLAGLQEEMARLRLQPNITGEGAEEFTLVVDEHDPDGGEWLEPLSQADRVNCVPLDGPVVDAAHLRQVSHQRNLPDGLADRLAAFYEHVLRGSGEERS